MADQVKSVFEGKWTVYKNDNFEAFLDAMAVGFLKKKVALNTTLHMEISVNEDTITVAMSVGPMSQKDSFKLGEQLGESGTGLVTFSDGKLTATVTQKDGKTPTIVREIVNDELVQTMTVDNVTAKRYFKRDT